MRVIIKKPDIDTCLTAFILGIEEENSVITVVNSNAPEKFLKNRDVVCIECGGSGDIKNNNFDHHDIDSYYPPASVQAFRLKRANNRHLRKLVNYVALLDETPDKLPPIDFPQLSAIFSGMLLCSENIIEQFFNGLKIIKKVVEYRLEPFKKMPELSEWEKYIQAKRENAANLNNALKKAEFFYTKKGCKIGILTFSGVGGMKYLYSKGCDIAILVNPDTKKISIGSINKNLSQLCAKLNEIEKGWGGRERIISSPFNGTNISEKFIKKICYKIF